MKEITQWSSAPLDEMIIILKLYLKLFEGSFGLVIYKIITYGRVNNFIRCMQIARCSNSLENIFF